MSDIEKIHGITPDLTRENVDRLLALFPDVATEITDPKTGRTERAVDFDALKERLGDVAEGNRERYQFTWPGKREAKRLAREPIAKTLRPVKERSKDWDTTQNLVHRGRQPRRVEAPTQKLRRQDQAHLHRPAVQHGTRLRLRRRFLPNPG